MIEKTLHVDLRVGETMTIGGAQVSTWLHRVVVNLCLDRKRRPLWQKGALVAVPVLIALAFRETALVAGIVLFVVVVGFGLLVRFYLERLRLLLVPRLTAILILVVLLHIVLGAFLACLVVLAFTRSWRSVIIAGVAIPASVVSTFAMMWLLGFTLNMMTTLALSLSTGLHDQQEVFGRNQGRKGRAFRGVLRPEVACRIEPGLVGASDDEIGADPSLPKERIRADLTAFVRPFGLAQAVGHQRDRTHEEPDAEHREGHGLDMSE